MLIESRLDSDCDSDSGSLGQRGTSSNELNPPPPPPLLHEFINENNESDFEGGIREFGSGNRNGYRKSGNSNFQRGRNMMVVLEEMEEILETIGQAMIGTTVISQFI